jgi:flagellar motor switch protein FliM
VPARLEARVQGAKMAVRDLLNLQHGDVVSLDISIQRPAEIQVNGKRKFSGEVVAAGNARGILVNETADKVSWGGNRRG